MDRAFDVFIAVEQFHLDCHRNSAKKIPLCYTLYSSLASRLFHEVCGIRHKTFYDASRSPNSKFVCFRLWFGLRVLRCCSTVFQTVLRQRPKKRSVCVFESRIIFFSCVASWDQSYSSGEYIICSSSLSLLVHVVLSIVQTFTAVMDVMCILHARQPRFRSTEHHCEERSSESSSLYITPFCNSIESSRHWRLIISCLVRKKRN